MRTEKSLFGLSKSKISVFLLVGDRIETTGSVAPFVRDRYLLRRINKILLFSECDWHISEVPDPLWVCLFERIMVGHPSEEPRKGVRPGALLGRSWFGTKGGECEGARDANLEPWVTII
jgi:hypothetical protein